MCEIILCSLVRISEELKLYVEILLLSVKY